MGQTSLILDAATCTLSLAEIDMISCIIRKKNLLILLLEKSYVSAQIHPETYIWTDIKQKEEEQKNWKEEEEEEED